MMLGLANGNVPKSLDAFSPELIAGWAAMGLRVLATAFVAVEDMDRKARELRHRLADVEISVAQYAGVNANLTHHDPDVRRAGRRAVAAAVPIAAGIGATMISSGCGTNSDDYRRNFYAPHPLNYTDEARDRLVDELRQIAPMVEDAGLLYSIECHQLTSMSSPAVIREVLDRVGSPAIVANFDPVNLLDSAEAVYDNAVRMADIVDIIGPRLGPSCHIKDVNVLPDFVCRIVEAPPGSGVLDLAAFFAAASRLPGPTALIVEHLDLTRFAEGIETVRQAAIANGVQLR